MGASKDSDHSEGVDENELYVYDSAITVFQVNLWSSMEKFDLRKSKYVCN